MTYWCVAKVLFLIVAGKEAPERADLAIMTASRQIKAGRYEDTKVLLYGPSEQYISTIKGDVRESFNEIVKAGALDSACVFIAKKFEVDTALQELGVKLLPFGERLAHYVNNGYEVITF